MKTKLTLKAAAAMLLLSMLMNLSPPAHAQGSLTPPAPPEPMMKTLSQIEPRSPISSLPFAITNSGSYYLTSNLEGGPTNGITISSDDVTLDLNGFVLMGPGTGAGIGIRVPAAQSGIHIQNGIIRSWGGPGVEATNAINCIFERLRGMENGGSGLTIGADAIVKLCTAVGNGQDGIVAGTGSSITDCTARGNGRHGLQAGSGSQFSHCTARLNLKNGISAAAQSTVTSSTALGNTEIGIQGDNGSTIVNCTSASNGISGINVEVGGTIIHCTANHNVGYGISAQTALVQDCHAVANGNIGYSIGDSSVVQNCSAIQNAGTGIEVSSKCRVVGNHAEGNGTVVTTGAGIHAQGGSNRIEKNHVLNNDIGLDVDTVGNIVLRNVASGNGTEYDIEIGNAYGPIVSFSGGGVITNANPWANFSD